MSNGYKIYAYEEYIKNNYSAIPRLLTLSLPVSEWVGAASPYRQIVNIEGVTKNSKIDLQLTKIQIEELQNSEISLVTENDDGTVLVYAIGDKPDVDYEVQATVTEVGNAISEGEALNIGHTHDNKPVLDKFREINGKVVYDGKEIVGSGSSNLNITVKSSTDTEYILTVNNGNDVFDTPNLMGSDGQQGVSGVYVGTGDMPEGYNIQIDPEGDVIVIPTKTSELENDSGFITSDQIGDLSGIDLTDYAKKSEIPTKTSDLENDSGYITLDDLPENGIVEETDPTVPSWAKQPVKPFYDASEISYENGSLVDQTGSVKAALDESIGFVAGQLAPVFPDLVNNTHTHGNTSTLNKLGDSNGQLTYNGDVIKGGSYELTTEDKEELVSAVLEEIPDGKDGLSAYQIWLNNGNTGTEAEFLASLKGVDGYTPQKGIDYFDGEKGDSFTYDDFTSEQLELLKGEDGTPTTHEWNGTVLTITSASGTSSVNLKGERGHSGVYVGTGTMPDDCNIKINPNGAVLKPIPTKTSDLTNDSGFITKQEIDALLEGDIGSVAEIYIGATEPSDENIVLWIDISNNSGSGNTGNDNTGGGDDTGDDNTGDEGEGGNTGGDNTGDTNGRLPSEYQEVEYVATPKQFYSEINTGVLSDTITKIEMGLKTDFSNYVAIVSGAQTTGTGENTDFSEGANDKQSPCINNLGANTEVKGTSAFTSFTTTAIPSDYMSGEHYVDFTFKMVCPISQYYCFGDSTNTGWNIDNREIYYFKMYDTNNVLVADFVPCYRKSDNKVGMYDLARQAFYAPSYREWTKGADV